MRAVPRQHYILWSVQKSFQWSTYVHGNVWTLVRTLSFQSVHSTVSCAVTFSPFGWLKLWCYLREPRRLQRFGLFPFCGARLLYVNSCLILAADNLKRRAYCTHIKSHKFFNSCCRNSCICSFHFLKFEMSLLTIAYRVVSPSKIL